MAGQIPAAKFVELPGDDHIPWIGNADPLLAEIQEFLTGETPVLEADRVLATVLFIDIVQSTQRVTAIGDSRWRDLVDNYHQQVRKEVVRLGGRVAARAAPGEILLSSTVKDLIAGSRVECSDRGSHVLKGVPGRWRLFAVKQCAP